VKLNIRSKVKDKRIVFITGFILIKGATNLNKKAIPEEIAFLKYK